ncbi:unnamed protein product, partial [Staurois parvus]
VAINLGTDDKNLVLHFNPQFEIHEDKQKILANSMEDNAWGEELKESFFPFQERSDITVCFHFEQDNRSPYNCLPEILSFPVRFPIVEISYLGHERPSVQVLHTKMKKPAIEEPPVPHVHTQAMKWP